MKTRVIVAVLVSWGVGAVGVRAAVFCEKKSGAVVVRDACKKKETALDLASFGALGPKGDPGTPGTPGSPGAPGVPGAAVAYAHVLANGSVDAANSKSVASANVTLDSSGIVPVFCFHDLSFTFHNVVATAAWSGVGTSDSLAQAALGDPASDCAESNVGAVVVTQSGSNIVGEDFFVVFN